MAISKVEAVVLGLLGEEPMYGYELMERLRARGMDAWAPVGKASVYQALRRLEAGGFVAGRSQQGIEGPDRRVYRITRPGKDELRASLVERFADEAEAPIALGFAHLLAAAALRTGLEAREAAIRARLEALAASRSSMSSARGSGWTSAARMLEREEALARADLAWLAAFRRSAMRARR